VGGGARVSIGGAGAFTEKASYLDFARSRKKIPWRIEKGEAAGGGQQKERVKSVTGLRKRSKEQAPNQGSGKEEPKIRKTTTEVKGISKNQVTAKERENKSLRTAVRKRRGEDSTSCSPRQQGMGEGPSP